MAIGRGDSQAFFRLRILRTLHVYTRDVTRMSQNIAEAGRGQKQWKHSQPTSWLVDGKPSWRSVGVASVFITWKIHCDAVRSNVVNRLGISVGANKRRFFISLSSDQTRMTMVKLTEEMVVARTRISDFSAVKKLNCWWVFTLTSRSNPLSSRQSARLIVSAFVRLIRIKIARRGYYISVCTPLWKRKEMSSQSAKCD